MKKINYEKEKRVEIDIKKINNINSKCKNGHMNGMKKTKNNIKKMF